MKLNLLPVIGIRLKALRAFSFPLSILPVLIAVSAVASFSEWKLDVIGASIMAVVLLHGAGNLINDFFDFKYNVDRKIENDKGRPGRFLVRGELLSKDIFIEVLVLLALIIPVSAYIIEKCGIKIIGFGISALVLLYGYTGPPLKLKYRALGELLIFTVFGPLLMLGAAYAQTGHFQWVVLLLSIPVGLATTTVVFINNIRDIDEDKDAGVTNIVHKIGKRKATIMYAIGIFIPLFLILCLVAGGVLGKACLIALIVAIPAVILLKKVISYNRLPDIDAQTAKYATVFFTLLLVGLVIW